MIRKKIFFIKSLKKLSLYLTKFSIYKINFKQLLFLIINTTTITFANNLTDLHQKIQQQEKIVKQQKNTLRSEEEQLRDLETKIKKSTNNLNVINKKLSQMNNLINKNQNEIDNLLKKKQLQKKMLARQIYLAYKLNKEEFSLNYIQQQDSAYNQRMKKYFSLLNNSRASTIKNLSNLEKNIQTKQKNRQEQLVNYQKNIQQQENEKQQLAKLKNEQASLVKNLNSELKQNQSKLEQLKENERKLTAEVNAAVKKEAEIEKANKQQTQEIDKQKPQQNQQTVYKGSGLGPANHQYNLPVNGRIEHRFGERIMGELTWKGIVIKANKNARVSAIKAGKVIMRSQLQGYGLVVVIDHGNGDLSLYGYNNSVNVAVGQNVTAGQAIATVGESINGYGLFFQITRKGRLVNPLELLRR